MFKKVYIFSKVIDSYEENKLTIHEFEYDREDKYMDQVTLLKNEPFKEEHIPLLDISLDKGYLIIGNKTSNSEDA